MDKRDDVGEKLITRGSMCGHFAPGGLAGGPTGDPFFHFEFPVRSPIMELFWARSVPRKNMIPPKESIPCGRYGKF